MSLVKSVEFLQLRLQRLEVADGLLKGRVRAQRLQLHQVAADVVETYVSKPASVKDHKIIDLLLSILTVFPREGFVQKRA